MKRMQATAWPSALLLASMSACSRKPSSGMPGAAAITQVPVDSTAGEAEVGAVPLADGIKCRSSEALLSWMPHRTRQSAGSPVNSASSGLSRLSGAHAGRNGGNSRLQPMRSTSDEYCWREGCHKSV